MSLQKIVICNWHYFDKQKDFPSLSAMQREGFRVIGVTWINKETIINFSDYAKKSNAYGLMATTWSLTQKKGASGFYYKRIWKGLHNSFINH